MRKMFSEKQIEKITKNFVENIEFLTTTGEFTFNGPVIFNNPNFYLDGIATGDEQMLAIDENGALQVKEMPQRQLYVHVFWDDSDVNYFRLISTKSSKYTNAELSDIAAMMQDAKTLLIEVYEENATKTYICSSLQFSGEDGISFLPYGENVSKTISSSWNDETKYEVSPV